MGGALVHEWLSRVGGSERVFDAMVEAFPDADLLTLWNDDPGRRYPGRPVRESWMARTPLRRAKAAALPLMPLTWRRRAGEYDWALVSSHAFAHHVTFRNAAPGFRKYVYVHTPARYVWTPELDLRGRGILARVASPPLRALDRRRAREAYQLAANSAFVRRRIEATWGLPARVIHPPVDVEALQSVPDWREGLKTDEAQALHDLPRPFLLGASRFIPYKRLDLVMKAGAASGMPVVLAGSGPEEPRLRDLAGVCGVPVSFVRSPSDALLRSLYSAASAYIFPAVEDFGIMPVEAMALGTPVIGLAVGGVAETVVDGSTGVHIHDPDDRSAWGDAVGRALALRREDCMTHARQFDRSRFVSALKAWLSDLVPVSR